VLADLALVPASGVSMIELRQFSRTGELPIPDWAVQLALLSSRACCHVERSRDISSYEFFAFQKWFLAARSFDGHHDLSRLPRRALWQGWRRIHTNVRFEKLEDVDTKFDFVINCAGIGARELVQDADLEPHRGQVAIVRNSRVFPARLCVMTRPSCTRSRARTIVFRRNKRVSDNLAADPATMSRIVAECSRVLSIAKPPVLAERVGLRPSEGQACASNATSSIMAAPSSITTATAAPVYALVGCAAKFWKSPRSSALVSSAERTINCD